MFKCMFCGSERKSKNSLLNHSRLCKENPNRQQSPFEDKSVQLARKKSNQHIKGTALPYSEDTLTRLKAKCKEYWTPEKRLEQSKLKKEQMQSVIEKYPESYSYKNFCGRSKKTLYNDQWMHSSWELIAAKWFDRNGIKWTKKVQGFKYSWNNSIKTYFPDFYLEDLDQYVEVKGYETDRDLEKWKAVPGLIVLKEKEIKLMESDKFVFGQVS